jgi:hypothetical protein
MQNVNFFGGNRQSSSCKTEVGVSKVGVFLLKFLNIFFFQHLLRFFKYLSVKYKILIFFFHFFFSNSKTGIFR